MDELMDEIAEKSGNKNFHHACELYRRNEITSSVLARIAKAAAKEYASQAIDQAASLHQKALVNDGLSNRVISAVKTVDILNVKHELK